MSPFRSRLLITLVLLGAIVLASGGPAHAARELSTISEHDDSPFQPAGGYSGEPDVGQTSPSSSGRVQGQSALRGVSGIDDVLRLAVWVWKARHGLTGF